MNTIKFPCKRDADDSSPFSHLPDEIILQILKKIDSKTLRCCYLVSKRFSSIVVQVTISLTLPRPLIQPSISDQNTFRDIDGGEENMEFSTMLKIHTAYRCLKEAILRHRMLMYIVKDIPSLEEVAITDSERIGRVSLSGEKLNEVKEFVKLDTVTVRSHMYRIEVPDRVSQCYVPVLELPVSGYVMKGVSVVVMEMNGVQGGIDSFVNSGECCEGKEEAAYNEAVMEIWEKHKGIIQRLHLQ